jgi:hypothetical protein
LKWVPFPKIYETFFDQSKQNLKKITKFFMSNKIPLAAKIKRIVFWNK